MRSTDAPARSGFILPTTLLVMTLLTVMLTAAFILASAEFRASDNTLANSRALALAQAGLENYFSQQRNLDTSSTYDSLRITFSNGYADVVGRRVRAITGSRLPLWLVRAIGASTDPRQPGQAQGQRAVAQLAELNNGLIPARAALTAVNGIQMVAGGSTTNPINGHNFGFSMTGCTIPGGSAADTAAYTIGSNTMISFTTVTANAGGSYGRSSGFSYNTYFAPGEEVVANGFTNASNNGYSTVTGATGNTLTVTKAPNTVAEAAGTRTISLASGNYLTSAIGGPTPSGTQQALPSISSAYDSTHVDWQRVLNGDFSPDYVNTWPAVCTGTCTYNSYYWTGNVTVPTGQRRALLIATGDVTLSAGTHWDGIIIAGGALKAVPGAANSYIIHGMAITGLNCGVGSCPATQDSIQRGSSNDIQWDWCYTHAAIGGLNGLVPLKNTWVDTWSLY